MKIKILWQRPIFLHAVPNDDLLIYSVNLEKISDGAGLYIFARHWGKSYEALYVGKTGNLRSRIRGHLNNLTLMRHLLKAKNGDRVLIIGKVATSSDKKVKKILRILEHAFIRKYLAEGHDLINQQGTRIRTHEILSDGPVNKSFIPTKMFLEKGKAE